MQFAYSVSLSQCIMLCLSPIIHIQHNPWTTFTCALHCLPLLHWKTYRLKNYWGWMNVSAWCIPPIQLIRLNLIAYVGSTCLASPCSINHYIASVTGMLMQPAGGAPLVRLRASTRLCMMYIAQGCSHTSRRPLDCVAGIHAAHHSGVPCIEIYSNINITRVTTPTNYLSYHAQ